MTSIFAFTSYRDYLRAYHETRLVPKKLSFRSVVRRAGIKNPSYVQQVMRGERNLTPAYAEKLAKGLGLDEGETAYLVGLAELERTHAGAASKKAMDRLHGLVATRATETRHEESIYSSWLHAVVWALAGIPEVELTPAAIARRLGGIATPAEAGQSLAFLERQGFLEPAGEPGRYRQAPIQFAPINDLRRFEIQRNHLRFLDLAKLRLADRLDEREYQGLTISVSRQRLAAVKEKLRAFVGELARELSHDREAEAVLRVQCCAYWVTRDDENFAEEAP